MMHRLYQSSSETSYSIWKATVFLLLYYKQSKHGLKKNLISEDVINPLIEFEELPLCIEGDLGLKEIHFVEVLTLNES